MFTLHPRLAEDSLPLGDFPLCTCRLMNDMHYPWLVLVPRVPGVREIFELSVRDQQQLLRESSWVSQQLAKYFRAEKINIAALGNLVPQLHVHHVVRYSNDAAWPGPVWGQHPAMPYTAENLNFMRETLMLAFRGREGVPFEWTLK
jgi:diadenosine tetraphosphate (Ap4A) HIT family hydrolase